MKPISCNNNHSGSQRSDSIQIGLKNKRSLIDEYVTNHSASDSR